MTLTAIPITGSLSVVTELAKRDEGSAQVLLRLALYEALCDEADRVRPALERDAAEHMAKRLDGALEKLAKSYATGDLELRAEAVALADQLVTMRQAVSKTAGGQDDDPSTPKWDARNAGGQFRRRLVNILDAITKPATVNALQQTVGDNADNYSRLSALGGALKNTQRPNVGVAGQVARLVGEIGPEAQNALEPGIRRAAYRYRGTERRPDPATQRQARLLAQSAELDSLPSERANMKLAAMPEGPEKRGLLALDTAVKDGQKALRADQTPIRGAKADRTASTLPLSPVVGAYIGTPGKGMTDDQLRMARVGDFGALTLLDQVPDMDSAKLSLAAGKMPPSIGMMFDEDGSLVSQAMGFNGDHYLPFDLKNLKRLQGGSYVRTRTSGGITDEDIYTGLLTGARQVQVISNSGSFTMEFDPHLRGGRRYSDKARQMVERYANLVKTIDSGSVTQTPLDPEVIAEIRRTAYENSGGVETTAQDEVREQTRRKMMEAQYSGLDEDSLHEQALAEAKTTLGNQASSQALARHAEEIFRTKLSENHASQAKNYRLDGEGYKAAMLALKTEFPYFIRDVRVEPLREFMLARGANHPDEPLPRRAGPDKGYTPRGGLDPMGVPVGQRSSRKYVPIGTVATRGSAAPATEPDAATAERNTTGGAPAQTINLPDKDAPSLEDAAKSAAPGVHREASKDLQATMALRAEYIGKNMTLVAPDGKQLEANSADILSNRVSGEAYADWVAANYTNMGVYVSTVLKDPKIGATHRAKAKEALLYMKENPPTHEAANLRAGLLEELAAAPWDQTIQRIDALAASPTEMFAPAAADMALAEPAETGPRPQPFPEIIALGASLNNMKAFAKQNPDICKKAAQFQAAPDLDKAAVADIAPQVENISALLAWSKDKTDTAKKPSTLKLSQKGEANELAAKGANHTKMKDLRASQMAWTLVKAADVVASLGSEGRGTEPVKFADYLPKAKAAKEPPEVDPPPVFTPQIGHNSSLGNTAKRWAPSPRLVRHDRNSPVAKALAARLSTPSPRRR